MSALWRPFNHLHFCRAPRQGHFCLGLFRNLHKKKRDDAQESQTSNRDNVGESTTCLTFAERCKNILVANWQGLLTTVKADSTGSKEELHSSPVQYIFRNGKPAIWIEEDDMHAVNTILDERGSFSIGQTDPPPLINFLRTIGKFPARVVLVGDVIPLEDDKREIATKELNDIIVSEKKTVSQASYPVTGILNSSRGALNARVKGLELMFDSSVTSAIYEFNMRSCSFLDISGNKHEVDVKDIEAAAIDPISPFFGALIEGINRSPTRRRGLMLFCSVYLNVNARDALLLSVDRKGFDVLAKISAEAKEDSLSSHFQWKEFSFSFGTYVGDIEKFCRLLAKMEEEALKQMSGFTI